MKGTEKIIAHISSDAEEKAGGILKEAENQCAHIRSEYRDKAEAAYETAMADGKRAIDSLMDSYSRVTHMEAKKDILSMKQELVAQCFEKALSMLTELPEEEYLDLLTRLIVRSSSTGDEEVVFNRRDRDSIGKKAVDAANEQLKAQLTVSEETGDFSGGVLLRRGPVTVNNTLDLLVESCKGELSAQLAKRLFT